MSDPITSSIISRAVARGLESATRVLSNKVAESKQRRLEILAESLERDADQFLLTALAELSKEFTYAQQVAVSNYIRSPDADSFVRSVAVAVLTDTQDAKNTNLEAELRVILCVIAGLEDAVAKLIAARLMKIFIDKFQRTSEKIRRGNKRYHEELIKRVYAEKSSGILEGSEGRVALLRSIGKVDYSSIDPFVDQYRTALHNSTSELIPAYFREQTRVPIDDLYIEPRFQSFEGGNKNQARSLTRDDLPVTLDGFLTRIYRAAVLGDPGAGKSTLVQKLSYDFSIGKGNLIPFVIPVRKYEDRKRTEQHSIVDFLKSYINEFYQIQAPTNSVEILLLMGRAIVIFDGVDELIDIGRRRDIVGAIENFAKVFSRCPMIVTSRIIGYDEAPVAVNIFNRFTLLEFTDADVALYAKNWFNVDKRRTARENAALMDSFMRESESVDDLRSNPLMLGLLCNVYQAARAIPQTRAELYERCAVMLFEEWDAGRGITLDGPLKADVKGALRDVALWIYTTDGLASGVGERMLRRRVTNYWLKKYEDEDASAEAASNLIKLWKGRSWVLTDMGTAPLAKESVYKFTHQTFLEYFSGVELQRKNHSPQQLWSVIEPQLSVGSWEIVALVAIQTLEDSYENAGDEIASLLVDSCVSVGDTDLTTRLNLLSFAARNLDSLSLTGEKLRIITDAAVDLALVGVEESCPSVQDVNLAGRRSSRGIWYNIETYYLSPLLQLLCYPHPAGKIITNQTAVRLSTVLTHGHNGYEAAAYILHEGADDLQQIAYDHFDHEFPSGLIRSNLSAEIEKIRRGKHPVLDNAMTENFWVPIVALRQGHMTVAEFVKKSALDSILCTNWPLQSVGKPPKQHISVAEAMVRQGIGLNSSNIPSAWILEEDALSEILHAIAIKVRRRRWMNSNLMGSTTIGDEIIRGEYINDPSELDPAELYEEQTFDTTPAPTSIKFTNPTSMFVLMFLIGVFLEKEHWIIADYSFDQMAALRFGPLAGLEPLVYARLNPSFRQDAIAVLESSNFREDDASLLRQWALRETDFTCDV
ncbi:putative NTPase (NACHT family) [Mycobacteroides abscessus subsp. abscessus]|uniref:NACHT domain-containing protein n=1 Tax=Mycobacteroides abscessus TaxID=36809 RepID=UPI0009289E32|nr:NACHT domain-containing protein [Mycobacteroides abscessus]SHU93121.1 putative NTPase (NACHT family) [Mycobacteroides abscessus subsp. abscessus]SHX72755.1 putative NTPase (NACHT family) [Mycobacteroides abscessus subsp. abscessus]SIG87172.1 putative NTPase (NACHT family) [Mycobacteroides abscessus subsp. abscessus]SKD18829.1 putative NTPase (NACHT family) [Mycobacteroides abscessus subsp. abscessus]SKN10364.1 putative NTPase (NACHT family) [Mycobacteroides abscessus subsp. abscessus]